MKKIYLSVVVPAYNEESSLKRGVLGALSRYLRQQKYSWEVLIVDDGSTDDTANLSQQFADSHRGFRVLKEKHKGKGSTVISGMLAAKGDIVLFSDFDQATPIKEIEKFFPKFKKGFDIVIGSRAGREGAPVIRKTMAYGFSLLRNLVLRLPFKDTQCGFKAFKGEAAKKIFGRMKIFTQKAEVTGASVSAGFDLEVLYIARKLKLKVAEVPVKWHHQEGTKVNPIKDSWEGFRDLLRVRINALTGRYPL